MASEERFGAPDGSTAESCLSLRPCLIGTHHTAKKTEAKTDTKTEGPPTKLEAPHGLQEFSSSSESEMCRRGRHMQVRWAGF